MLTTAATNSTFADGHAVTGTPSTSGATVDDRAWHKQATRSRATDENGGAVTSATDENGGAVTSATDENGDAATIATDENGGVSTTDTFGHRVGTPTTI